MAPEYLAPGVYVEETSLKAPTKDELAFGSGRTAREPSEAQASDEAPGTATTAPRTLRETTADPSGDASLRTPLESTLDPSAFDGGQLEAEEMTFTFEEIKVHAVDPVEPGDPDIAAFDG